MMTPRVERASALCWSTLPGSKHALSGSGCLSRDRPFLHRQRQHTLTFEPRLPGWQSILIEMLEALDEGIAEPGLTEFATDRLARLG